MKVSIRHVSSTAKFGHKWKVFQSNSFEKSSSRKFLDIEQFYQIILAWNLIWRFRSLRGNWTTFTKWTLIFFRSNDSVVTLNKRRTNEQNWTIWIKKFDQDFFFWKYDQAISNFFRDFCLQPALGYWRENCQILFSKAAEPCWRDRNSLQRSFSKSAPNFGALSHLIRLIGAKHK